MSLDIDSPRNENHGVRQMDRREIVSAGERWLQYLLHDCRRAPSTVAAYRSQLRLVLRSLPADYSASDLTAALNVRVGHHSSPHVRRSSFVALDAFFKWWAGQGGGPNPLQHMTTPPKPRVRRRSLTPLELEMLGSRLANLPDLKPKAEILLMLFQGFRVGDVCNLTVKDIDFPGMTIRCSRGKGGTVAELPMSPSVATILGDYLVWTGIREGHVFPGRFGRMTPQAVWKAWRRVCGTQLAGICPHMLRHSYCNLLLRGMAKADINTTRRLMRHSNLAVTQLYLDDDEVAERAAIVALDQQISGGWAK